MSTIEAETTRFGEVLDLIACEAIQNGAKPKKKPITDLSTILFGVL